MICSLQKYGTQTLNIFLAPPPKLTIFEGTKAVHGTIGPYKEGSELELFCELTGGDQKELQLHWLMDAVVIDVSYKAVSNRKLRNSLWLKSIQRRHLMSTVTCLATKDNSSSGALLKNSVHLDVFLRPLDVTIAPRLPSVREGQPLHLTCISRGSRPPAVVTWWMGNYRLFNTTEELRKQNSTTSTIILHPSIVDHSKSITCRAENSEIRGSLITDNVSLNVTFQPRVSLSLKTYSTSSIVEGGTVALMCNVKSNPVARRVTWTFLKGPFYDVQAVEENGPEKSGALSLVLEKLEPGHKGSYKCTATNSVGTTESNTLWLAVRHRPVCTPGQKVSYGAHRGELLHIRCEVDAEPPMVSFYWSFSNTVNRHNNVSFTSRGLRSVATYTPTNDLHLGSLFCWANNSVGEQYVPCTFTVYLPAEPNPPKECQILNVTSMSFLVSCQPGYDGGAEQKFHLSARIHGMASTALNISSMQPLFNLTGFPPGIQLDIYVHAVNKIGQSQFVVLKYTSTARESMEKGRSSRLIWLSCLLIALTTFVAAAIVTLMKTSHSPLL